VVNRAMPTRLLAAVFVACLIANPPMCSASASENASDRAPLHLLNRLAFGPTLADLKHVEAIGIDRYIEEQLNPQTIPEPAELIQRLTALDTLKLEPAQLFAIYGPQLFPGEIKPSAEEIKARRQRAQVIVRQAAEARILRATISRRQLQEVMVDFWYNHFNVFAGKGLVHLWVGAYEEQAIRPYALGKFKDLLLATARHPAMLFYLDNVQNSAPGSRGPGGKELGLNENFAREVMELHTLGVDGGYTQTDVITLARILTGWTLERPNLRRGTGDAFGFEASRHDFGPKVFLGHPIQSSGEAEGEEALERLAKSPATAYHIAFELAQYFVADMPPSALVDRLAARFHDSDGEIRVVLKALFTSREFRDSVGDKYKTPDQFVLSAVRAAGVAVQNPRPLLGMMARLGMPLYHCPTPDGYKNTQDAWLNPDATTSRINFATAFARGSLPIESLPPATPEPQMISDPAPAPGNRDEPVDAMHLERVLGASLSGRTRDALAAAPAELRAAMILGSPDFMRR
jgi:Protein of unknown function (DUF1800)